MTAPVAIAVVVGGGVGFGLKWALRVSLVRSRVFASGMCVFFSSAVRVRAERKHALQQAGAIAP